MWTVCLNMRNIWLASFLYDDVFYFTIPVFVWATNHPSKLYRGCGKLLPIEIPAFPPTVLIWLKRWDLVCCASPRLWILLSLNPGFIYRITAEVFSAFIKIPARLNCPTVKVDEWILCVTPLQVAAINSGSNWQMFVPWRRTHARTHARCGLVFLRHSRGFITTPLGSGYNVTGEKYSILFCLAAILGCKCEMLKAFGAQDPELKVRSSDTTQRSLHANVFIDGVSFSLPCSWSGV